MSEEIQKNIGKNVLLQNYGKNLNGGRTIFSMDDAGSIGILSIGKKKKKKNLNINLTSFTKINSD